MLKKIGFLILFSLLFLSCKTPIEEKVKYKEYEVDIAWELELALGNRLDEKTQYGRYLYAVEWNLENQLGYISKIDLLNPKQEWRTEELFKVSFKIDAQILATNGYVFIIFKDTEEGIRYLYIFEDSAGRLLATIKLNDEETDPINVAANGRLYYYNENLYWIWNNLCKLPFSEIDFSCSPNTKQFITPDYLWFDEEYGLHPLITPIQADNILYFQTYDIDDYNDETPTKSKVIAFDLENEKELWHYNCKKLYGYGLDNMIIVDKKLYIIEQGIGCFDLETGICLHESSQSLKDLMQEDDINGGIYSDGIAYHDGKFFYTNTASWTSSSITGIPRKNIHNIICLDTKTLKFVWGQLPEGSGSQSACPTIMNGKVFVPLWLRGLCVLDEKTGEILGINTSIISYGSDGRSIEYNGLAMFFDYSHYDKDNMVTLVAIRP